MKPRIVVDIDGVLYDWHSTVRFLMMKYRGISLPDLPQLFDCWDGHTRYLSPDDIAWLWTVGVEKGLFRHGHVLKGSIQALEQLSEVADIVIATHRPAGAANDTLSWLAFHRVPCKEVHLLYHEEPKWVIPADGIVDDKPENVLSWANERPERPRLAVLWRRPWNESVTQDQLSQLDPWVLHTNNWEEVIHYVRTIWRAQGTE
jgi:5'(3')-deoxyribonucleotidase